MTDLNPFHRQNVFMAYEMFKYACRSVEMLLRNVYSEYTSYMVDNFGTKIQLQIVKSFNSPAMLMAQMEECQAMPMF